MTRILVIPGLFGSGPEHWQTWLEGQRPDAERVEQANWDRPQLAAWVQTLDRYVQDAPGDVLLVAHSLGCLTVAHWARGHGERRARRVRGALLVAPPDVEQPGLLETLEGLDAGAVEALRSFAPVPREPLPFPAVLVASTNDEYASFDAACDLGEAWGARVMNVGAQGHVNTASGHGPWPYGLELVDELLGE